MDRSLSIVLVIVMALGLFMTPTALLSDNEAAIGEEPLSATTEPDEVTVETPMSPSEALIAETKRSLMEQLDPVPLDGSGKKIGVLIISLTNPFWVNLKERYEEAAAELGIEVEVLSGTTEGDTTSQLETLMTMATKDYDAIILSPIEGTNLIPGIIQLNQLGIPVINLGPGVDEAALEEAGGHLDGKITVQFAEQGEMIANDMMSRLPDGGEVAILQGLVGAGQSEGRSAGAKAAFEADERFPIVAIQPCDWDATKAYDATKDILLASPNLKGIFAVNDVMALAASEALLAEGRDDVLVYGVDFTNDAKAAIQEGRMTGSVTYSGAIYTHAAFLLALKTIDGQTLDGPVYCPLTLVTVDNIDDYAEWK
ncbi:MAG TPA: substrate-binding domain-containing protein [Fastidiosipila sp.]|nr:substrate-binding domain-containing protein [Fastidiosipila sp.]